MDEATREKVKEWLSLAEDDNLAAHAAQERAKYQDFQLF